MGMGGLNEDETRMYVYTYIRINEYLARFKRDATPARKRAHAEYKRWTANTRQKQMAGFSASLRGAAGDADDSLDQSQND